MYQLQRLLGAFGLNAHRFRRRPDSDSWFSISPVRFEDGRAAGIGVTGPTRGVAVYRHRPIRSARA